MRPVGLRHGNRETLFGRVKRLLSRTGGSTDTGSESNREEKADESRPKHRTMTEFAFETGRTPEMYVVQLLSMREGEMRQQELIAETGWSRSSVSRLLCEMEATGDVVRVRLGDGNVVYFPETVPMAVRRFESMSVART